MISLLTIPVCALADRLRGGLYPRCKHCDALGEVIYGAALAFALGLPLAYWIPLIGLWTLGGRPGWGYPMGQAILGKERHKSEHPFAEPERWQVGFLPDQPWLSLIVRGVLWGVPTLAIAYWQPAVWRLPIFMGAAMPLGALFDHLTGYRYKAHEWIRGALMGGMCIA